MNLKSPFMAILILNLGVGGPVLNMDRGVPAIIPNLGRLPRPLQVPVLPLPIFKWNSALVIRLE